LPGEKETPNRGGCCVKMREISKGLAGVKKAAEKGEGGLRARDDLLLTSVLSRAEFQPRMIA